MSAPCVPDEAMVVSEIGEIESSKAVSTLYAPAPGRLVSFNEALLNDPSAINWDNYGAGWLFDFESPEPFLTPPEYLQLLHDTWKDTQRMIRKQMD